MHVSSDICWHRRGVSRQSSGLAVSRNHMLCILLLGRRLQRSRTLHQVCLTQVDGQSVIILRLRVAGARELCASYRGPLVGRLMPANWFPAVLHNHQTELPNPLPLLHLALDCNRPHFGLSTGLYSL